MKNICNLIGFNLIESKKIKIVGDYIIRKLYKYEKRKLRKLYHLFMGPFWVDLKVSDFCISNRKDIRYHDFYDFIEKFIEAIWLFSGYAVSRGGIYWYDKRDPKNNKELYGPSKTQGRIWNATDLHIKKFRKFLINFKKIRFNKDDIAIQYFIQTMYSGGYENKLLSLTIALERILIPYGRDELRYKFSTRAAFILENEIAKRKQIQKFFREMYDLRSSIIHGSETKVLENDYIKYFEYSRKLICLFIENQENWKNLLEDASLGENRLNYNLANLILEE